MDNSQEVLANGAHVIDHTARLRLLAQGVSPEKQQRGVMVDGGSGRLAAMQLARDIMGDKGFQGLMSSKEKEGARILPVLGLVIKVSASGGGKVFVPYVGQEPIVCSLLGDDDLDKIIGKQTNRL